MLHDELFSPELSDTTEVACSPSSHTETELERHDEKVEGLLNEREEMRRVGGGYAFRFPGTSEWAERIVDFVQYERKCCRFLTFEIAFEPEGRGIWLYVGGSEDVEDYLVEEAGKL